MAKKKETVRGSSNGGKKRAKTLSAERRREIARMGGTKTWANIRLLQERLEKVLA